jgi:hypothetical protein
MKAELFAVIHSRKLDFTRTNEIKVDGSYSLSLIANQEPALVDEYVKHFNTMISRAD